ncbi:MAG: phytanoyl-CoA dioxygenase family protein [Pseudomonadota bacterium]
MEIQDWKSVGPAGQLYKELKQLDLLENIAELDVFGFTIVPPEKVGPPEFHTKIKKALIQALEGRFGKLKSDGTSWEEANQIFRLILWEDPVFEELLMNPAGLGLVQHLLGTNCILSLFDGWVKGPGEARTPIHMDHWDFTRKTSTHEPNSANFNYMVTDYSAEDGAISFVPGSNKWHRFPSPAEVKYWADNAHPIEAPAGSMVIWGDQTWHGSAPRTKSGERLMILGTFSRPFMQTQEPFRQTVTEAALARNPIRFAGLMDVYGSFPFGKEDVDAERLSANVNNAMLDLAPYRSLFDREPAGEQVSLRPDYEYDNFDRERWEALAEARAARAMSRNKAN